MNSKILMGALLAGLALAPSALAGGSKTQVYTKTGGTSAFKAAVNAGGSNSSTKGIFQFGSFAPPAKTGGGGGGGGGGGYNNGGCNPPPPCNPQPECKPPFGAPEIDPNLAVAGALLLIGGALVLSGRR